MCCFSGKVEKVADTNIFARLDGKRQALVYAMRMSAKADMAMVLPIPTPAQSAEDALEFVNLEKYPDFFKDMEACFPRPKTVGRGSKSRGADEAKLAVQQVGAFEASFVPSIADFSRLEERYQVPADAWKGLPQYKDWGFAVFKLREGAHQEVHPMAFWFPTRLPDEVFFPTVHIHDGTAPKVAKFDHTLYCQLPANGKQPKDGRFASNWRESTQPVQFSVDAKKARQLIAEDQHGYRMRVVGERPNADLKLVLV